MKWFSKLVSILFHPIFLTAFVMAYLLFVSNNPVLAVPPGKEVQWFLITAYSTLFMPLFVVFLLWKLKFIQSLEMKTTKERYVPLIACMSFYFWVFWIFHLNLGASSWIKTWLLASFATMVLTFLITIFNKISLHVAGIVSAFIYALLLNLSTGWNDLVLLVTTLVVLGLVIFSRMDLKAHTRQQLVVGGSLGAVASVVAYFIFG